MTDIILNIDPIFKHSVEPIKWKGKTFNQISSSIQMNRNSTVLSPYNVRLPQPLKHYRKELIIGTPTTVQRSKIIIQPSILITRITERNIPLLAIRFLPTGCVKRTTAMRVGA
jgi:hypothetical protein